MLEMNRTEFEKALQELKQDHSTALSNLNESITQLEEQLKSERAEKTSALQKVRQLTAGPDDSPRTAHIAQLESTLSQLRAEVARRDVADAPNAPSDVCAKCASVARLDKGIANMQVEPDEEESL